MRKQALTLEGIQEKIDNIRGAVTMGSYEFAGCSKIVTVLIY